MLNENIIKLIKKKTALLADTIRSHAVETTEWEYIELEHIFALLVLGSYVGLPSPPIQISLELLPDMEKSLILLLERTDTARGPLSELASILNIT